VRDIEIHERLLAWAQYVTVGDGSGYPTMSVLHPQWQPPTPGTTPTMKVSSPSSARQTHRAIGMLKAKSRDALVMHYVKRLPMALQAEQLGCAESTVYTRVETAKRELLGLLSDGPQSTFCNKEEVG
jgi:DNA-directed RNA polymerase specialized sigma24 family protein